MTQLNQFQIWMKMKGKQTKKKKKKTETNVTNYYYPKWRKKIITEKKKQMKCYGDKSKSIKQSVFVLYNIRWKFMTYSNILTEGRERQRMREKKNSRVKSIRIWRYRRDKLNIGFIKVFWIFREIRIFRVQLLSSKKKNSELNNYWIVRNDERVKYQKESQEKKKKKKEKKTGERKKERKNERRKKIINIMREIRKFWEYANKKEL